MEPIEESVISRRELVGRCGLRRRERESLGATLLINLDNGGDGLVM